MLMASQKGTLLRLGNNKGDLKAQKQQHQIGAQAHRITMGEVAESEYPVNQRQADCPQGDDTTEDDTVGYQLEHPSSPVRFQLLPK